ncbi:Up in starvation [Sporothrix curviconia]|uniref:Up in starvation n=1 Tax=Sporothrix curviconia TaxID=1260050 RepID=A0ABP0CHZ7_9PEZI
MDSAMDDGIGPVPVNGNHASQVPLADSNSNSHSSGDAASDHSSAQMQRSHSQGSKSNAATTHSDEAGDIDMSDNESNADDTATKAGRKKKSQRFYCTDFPPCNLSFTRSEHLARHIRKHTGERPFECHCLRRFSRLDNLRQHAQTVHMHEDIPLGSLAATGTRFQRQIRPDRVVRVAPPGSRARAGSLSGPGRGHSKSFSTSNIALSSGPYGVHDDMRNMRDMRDMRDMRPRPPPLTTIDPHARPQQIETGPYHASHEGYQPITPPEMTTPTSTTFSNGPATPHWGSTRGGSPFGSRPHSMYATTETPSRRLSVPSAEAYFQSPPSSHPPRGHMYSASASSNGGGGGFFPSPTQASLHPASPDTSTASGWSRRESISSTTDERRRTWHPSSRDFGNPAAPRSGPSASGPSMSASAGNINAHYQPSAPHPPPPLTVAVRPDQQNTNVRLPGIDSFLHRPVSPVRRAPSPMAVDSQRYPTGPSQSILCSPVQQHSSQQRPSSGHWDGLQHGINQLDIAAHTPPQEPGRDWNHQPYPNDGRAQQSVRFEPEVAREDPFVSNGAPNGSAYTRGHQHTMSAPAFNGPTSRQAKREAWYNGPKGTMAGANAARGGGPGRGTNGRVERMVHPNLANGFSGFPARGVPQTVHEHEHQPQDREPYARGQERYAHEQEHAYAREQEHIYAREQERAYAHGQERSYGGYHGGPPPSGSLGGHGPPMGPSPPPAAPPAEGDVYQSGLDALVAVATSESKKSASAF